MADEVRAVLSDLLRRGFQWPISLAIVSAQGYVYFGRYLVENEGARGIVDAGVLREAASKIDRAAGTISGTTTTDQDNTATAQSA